MTRDEGGRWNLRRVFRLPAARRRARYDVEQELAFHLEGRIDDLVAAGVSRDEAEREARRRFGDFDSYRTAATTIDEQIIQEQRRMDVIDTILRELRQAARVLRRAPGFTITAIITLALGLGGATAIYTMLDAVVLRPLPYRDADQLVSLSSPVPKFKGDTLWGLARHEIFYFMDNARSIAEIGVWQNDEAAVQNENGLPAETVKLANVSASLMHVLGLGAARGRLFTLDDNSTRQATVVVLGNAYWKRRFGGDTAMVGRVINIEGYPFTVVGIMREGQQLPDHPVDIWMPAYVHPTMQAMNNHTWSAIGRLRPGYDAKAAERELAPLTARLPEVFPQAEPENFVRSTGFRTQVRPLRDVVVGDVMIRALWILFGSVMVVLFIAAANLSNLFLVRLDARRREMAVRAALGADRVHLAVQLFAESLIIAVAAGALAVLLAAVGLKLLLVYAPSDLPRLAEVHVSAAGVVFALGGAVLTAFVLGLAPLLGKSPLDVGLLREGGRGQTVSRRGQTVRAALVVSQVALSLVLLTASALMVRSFANLRSVKPGFDPSGVLTMVVGLPQGVYGRSGERTSTYFEQLVTQVQQLPGVKAAGLSQSIPLVGSNLCTGVNIEGAEAGQVRGDCPPVTMVSPGYFEAMGIRVAGQPLTWGAMNAHSGNMIVSRAFADHVWPGESPLNRGIKYNGTKPPWYHVSGVADDVLAAGLDQPPITIVYFPMLTIPGAALWGVPTGMTLVVRTSIGNPTSLSNSIAKVAYQLEPQVGISNVQTMDALVAKSMSRRSFTMLLLGIAAAMALFLSVVGLYGVITYVVGQRRGEIAIRMALGAQASAVGRMVVGQSIRLTLLGIGIGVIVAIATMHVLGSLLFGVSATDPSFIAGSAALLLVVAAAAAYAPAHKASRVDPADAMRST